MSKEELIKLSVEEFSRLQKWMLSIDETAPAYQMMMERYIELKVILASLSVNIASLDKIKK